jgi:hypothetical protein
MNHILLLLLLSTVIIRHAQHQPSVTPADHALSSIDLSSLLASLSQGDVMITGRDGIP